MNFNNITTHLTNQVTGHMTTHLTGQLIKRLNKKLIFSGFFMIMGSIFQAIIFNKKIE